MYTYLFTRTCPLVLSSRKAVIVMIQEVSISYIITNSQYLFASFRCIDKVLHGFELWLNINSQVNQHFHPA